MSRPILTEFQQVVAQLFFSLPEADGYLLAGGAALVAHELTARPTQDLDLFAHHPSSRWMPDATRFSKR